MIDVRDGRADGRQQCRSTCRPVPSFTVRPPTEGLRYYVAVRGGFDVEPVLGSRSFDTLAGLGPRLRAGDRIAIGPDPRTPMTTDLGFHQHVDDPHPRVRRAEIRLVHHRGMDAADNSALRRQPGRQSSRRPAHRPGAAARRGS